MYFVFLIVGVVVETLRGDNCWDRLDLEKERVGYQCKATTLSRAYICTTIRMLVEHQGAKSRINCSRV